MRKSKTVNDLKVNAISGTYVVMMGFSIPEDKCTGLLGFSIHRYDETENEAYYLKAMKTFTETDPGFLPGTLYSTKGHPIQSFQWADYSAKPGHSYEYTITAVKGTPVQLIPFAETKIKISTESPESGNHDIYFNRGIAASQEYVRRFGNKRPEQVPNNKAYEWLSRGLYEALENYITSCVPGKHGIRFAAYEFHYEPFLKLIKDTFDKGVKDIEIVYDARKDYPRDINKAAIKAHGLTGLCTERTETKSYISHNKFIIKLENGKPVSVWTGGTNFSEGGIFGHSNVAHIIENEKVAENFLKYWEALKQNPKSHVIKKINKQISPLPGKPVPDGTKCIFSPRKTLDALGLYSDLALEVKDGLFITFAFGINRVFKNVYLKSKSPLRFALLEKMTRPMKKGPARIAEEQDIQNLRNMKENIFAVGDFVRTNKFDGWVKEKLSGLNSHVRYIHNKFMLIDPLSSNPVVITGSANFSNASTTKNDENMVIIKGNKRVADIYLGEYMRLFSHHAFRESLKWRKPNQPPKPLRIDDWWKDYFGDNDRSARRKYFAQTK